MHVGLGSPRYVVPAPAVHGILTRAPGARAASRPMTAPRKGAPWNA
jgi:hypothetical protein